MDVLAKPKTARGKAVAVLVVDLSMLAMALMFVWYGWQFTVFGYSQTSELTGINNPWDIALDWQTNLYVAEYYSNRVLKVTPSGARSTFASNGFADGLVRSPGGVTVDAYNNIVISDFAFSTSC